jgi:hypothetical protein
MFFVVLFCFCFVVLFCCVAVSPHPDPHCCWSLVVTTLFTVHPGGGRPLMPWPILICETASRHPLRGCPAMIPACACYPGRPHMPESLLVTL